MKKIRFLRFNLRGVLKKILLLIVVLAMGIVCNAQTNEIVKAEYFIDTDPGFGLATSVSISSGTSINVSTLIPLTNIQQGFHNLFFRVQDNNGKWSITQTMPFYTIVNLSQNKITQAEYFVDTDPGFGNGNNVQITSANNVTTTFNVDLSSTSQGLHVLFVRAKDLAGKWSLCESMTFFCMRNILNNQIAKIEYFLDTDPGFGKGTQISYTQSSNVSAVFNIPLPNATNGFHVLYVRSQDNENKWGLCQTMPFVRIQSPVNNKITDIEYFWDTDPGFGLGTNVQVTPAAANIDYPFTANTESLSVGVHMFNVRVKDLNNNWSLVYSQPDTIVITGVNNITNNNKAPDINIYSDFYQTNITYNPTENSNIQIQIFDIQGRLIKTFINSNQTNGGRNISFSNSNLSSGIYFCKLISNENVQTKKFTIIR